MARYIRTLIILVALSLVAVGCMSIGSVDQDRALSVVGKIIDPDEGDVSGFEVSIGDIKGTASSDGTFALNDVPYGNQLLIVSTNDGIIHAEEVAISKREVVLEVVLTGVPFADVYGSISGLRSIVIVDGLKISVGGQQSIMSADGTFVVEEVPVGDHTLIVTQAAGNEILSTNVNVTLSGANVTLMMDDFCGPAEQLSDGNLLGNPGFETCELSWRRNWANHGAVHEIDKTESYSGTTSLRFSGEESNHSGVMAQTLAVEGGESYRVAFARKLEMVSSGSSLASSIRIQFMDRENQTTRGHLTIEAKTGSHDWEWHEEIVEMPINTVKVYFEIWMREATGTAWWDDLFFGLDE